MDRSFIGIHQPNFLPWAGYFLKIALCDQFIFLDDVLIDFGGYARRAKISTIDRNSTQWLTLPLTERTRMADINQYHIQVDLLGEKIFHKLEINYPNQTTYGQEIISSLKKEIVQSPTNLAPFNAQLIQWIAEKLDIKTNFSFSSHLPSNLTSGDRTIDLVKRIGGENYLSGISGRNYLDTVAMKAQHIQLHLLESKRILDQYVQKNGMDDLMGESSIIEWLCLLGWEGVKIALEEWKGSFLNGVR